MESTQLVDCTGRRAIARHPAGLPLRPPARQQRASLPSRSTDRGGDHLGHAGRRRQPGRRPVARRDRRALARRATDQRSACPERERSRLRTRRGAGEAREGRQASGSRDGPVGMGATEPVAGAPCHPPGRIVILRAAGPDPRAAVFGRRDPCPAPHRSSCRRRSPTGCAAPAATRSRRRDVPRGCPATGHTAATRACRSRDHVGVPARNRQHRDRPRRSRAASADDLGHKRASARALTPPATEAAPSARPRPPANHQRAQTALPAE